MPALSLMAKVVPVQTSGIVHRQAAERRRDTLERLDAERDLWVATAHPAHGPHQVPLWFVWDGRAVWMCTSATSATVRVHAWRGEPELRGRVIMRGGTWVGEGHTG